jgi:hypothetical protein
MLGLIKFFLKRISQPKLFKLFSEVLNKDIYIPAETDIINDVEIFNKSKFERYLKTKKYVLTSSLYGKSIDEQNFINGRVAELSDLLSKLKAERISGRKNEVVFNEDLGLRGVEELNKLKNAL